MYVSFLDTTFIGTFMHTVLLLCRVVVGVIVVNMAATIAVSCDETIRRRFVAEIEKAGGKVYCDKTDKDQVTGIHLSRLQPSLTMTIAPFKSQIKTLSIIDHSAKDSDLTFVKDLSALESFYILFAGNVTDVSLTYLSNLAQLQRISFVRCGVSGKGLSSLVGLPRLKLLDLANNPLDFDDLSPLGELSNLEQLVLGGTPIDDSEMPHIARLKRLKTLYLSDTKVSDAGLKHLYELKALKNLYLSEPLVTEAEVKKLKTARPAIFIILDEPEK